MLFRLHASSVENNNNNDDDDNYNKDDQDYNNDDDGTSFADIIEVPCNNAIDD